MHAAPQPVRGDGLFPPEALVHDVNREPELPFGDEEFDPTKAVAIWLETTDLQHLSALRGVGAEADRRAFGYYLDAARHRRVK